MNVATKKLSFAELKEKATNTSQNEVMEKIQGGAWHDCHGFWGTLVKAMIKHGGCGGCPIANNQGGGDSGFKTIEEVAGFAVQAGFEISPDAYSDENLRLAYTPAG